MAEALREKHELTALSCRLEIRGRKPVVLSQVFRGPESLGSPIVTDLEVLTRGEHLTPGEWSDHELSLHGTRIEEQLRSAVHSLEPTKPVWLQIGRGASKLAALPWERCMSPVINRALLRIPNFLVNPFEPGQAVRVAICASWPLAKGAGDLTEPIKRLLATLARASAGTSGRAVECQIDIFTDYETYYRLTGQLQYRETGPFSVTLRSPDEAAPFNAPSHSSPRIDQSDRIKNQWLRWLASTYKETGVDIVHFICPGYFFEESGALALSESPGYDSDPEWSRFVGVKELAKFYDRVGCNAMGFTVTGALKWGVGLRILAYELSWQRPGPVLLDCAENFTALENAYGALLRGREFDPAIVGDLQFCVHPDALIDVDPADSMIAPMSDFNATILTIERSGKVPDESVVAPGQAPSVPELYSRTLRERSGRFVAQKDFSQQILRSERANLSSVKPKSELDEAREAGAIRALDFLAQLTQSE
jgi:hypothetical protein